MTLPTESVMAFVLWLLPIVFTAGGGWYALRSLSKAVDAMAERIKALEAHAALPGHAVTLARLDALENSIPDQLRALDERVRSIEVNVAAIAAALGQARPRLLSGQGG